jgi:adenylylsulfate kinase
MQAPANRTTAPVIWLTGLSGAGKTTLARALTAKFEADGRPVEWLDGDEIRGILKGTGFSRDERNRHVERIGFLASRLAKHGVTVIVSLISPYRESRDFARSLCARFVEVHVSTPMSVCESRDVKGLYRKARAGELKSFTGVDDPYEEPINPELRIDTSAVSVADAVARILEKATL